jgi:predicted MFS family arabinose efflux permease
MSVSGMTFRIGQTLGPLLMGMVISVWGIGGAFYAGAVLSVAMFIIMLRL